MKKLLTLLTTLLLLFAITQSAMAQSYYMVGQLLKSNVKDWSEMRMVISLKQQTIRTILAPSTTQQPTSISVSALEQMVTPKRQLIIPKRLTRTALTKMVIY